MDIRKPIINLIEARKIFHSEADFQFALAWEIQAVYPEAKIRLEYCHSKINSDMHIDILVIVNNEWYPIELKYKTLKMSIEVNQELYMIKDHSARDTGRYDYLIDIERIEYLSKAMNNFNKGYTILLTNDSGYWNKSTYNDTVFEEFELYEGQEKRGKMKWAEHTGIGTKKGREKSIELSGTYTMDWNCFSKFPEVKNGEFKYVISEVVKPGKE